MGEKEVEIRLRALLAKAQELLSLLNEKSYTPEVREKIEWLARTLKEELRAQEKQVSRWRRDDGHTFEEIGIYKPSIEEAYGAISALRVDGTAKKAWYGTFEEVRYKLGKYLKSKTPQTS